MTARTFAWDEGHGGAYFVEGGVLCHAEWRADLGRFDWESAAQVDSRDLRGDDPGWDFARAVYARLTSWSAPCLHCGAAGGLLDRRHHEPGCSIVEAPDWDIEKIERTDGALPTEEYRR